MYVHCQEAIVGAGAAATKRELSRVADSSELSERGEVIERCDISELNAALDSEEMAE